MFIEKYRRAFADLDLSLTSGHRLDLAPYKNLLDRLQVPQALKDYYATCGLHQINRRRNRLLLPEELYRLDERLIFLAEEQEAAFWGTAPSGTDPEVWQGNTVVGESDLAWFGEEMPLSDFLIAMWRWEITGEEPKRA